VERYGDEDGKENSEEKDSASQWKLLGSAQAPAEAVGGTAPKAIPQSVSRTYRPAHYLQEMLGLSFANSRQAACCFACRALSELSSGDGEEGDAVGTTGAVVGVSLRAQCGSLVQHGFEMPQSLRLAPYQFMSLRLAVIVRIFPHRLHRPPLSCH